MKKVLGLIFVLVFFSSCSVENISAQSANDTQRIVGSWSTEGGGAIFTFNADGTFTFSGPRVTESERREGNYMIDNSRLILRNSWNILASSPRDYYISADGRILVFEYTYYDTETRLTYRGFLWLIKQ